MDNGAPSFPSSRFLGVACVIVPKGSPPPLEWMAAHPNYVTVRGVIIPRAPLELDMELEPRPESEGQAEPLPEKPTYRVELDYAGNWIIKGVTVMMPRPAPRTDPPSARPKDPEPGQWQRPPTPADPPPGSADGISILASDQSAKVVWQLHDRDPLQEESEGSNPRIVQIADVSEGGDDGDDNRDGESSSSATSADHPIVYAESRALYELYKLYEEAKRLFGFSKLPREPSPALADNPYNPRAVQNRRFPKYAVNESHVPGRGLTWNKTPLPPDAESVYESWVVRGDMQTWWGRGKLGFYRYSDGNDGTVHFTGIIPPSQIPSWIVKLLEK
jgi:hypothetical protein